LKFEIRLAAFFPFYLLLFQSKQVCNQKNQQIQLTKKYIVNLLTFKNTGEKLVFSMKTSFLHPHSFGCHVFTFSPKTTPLAIAFEVISYFL